MGIDQAELPAGLGWGRAFNIPFSLGVIHLVAGSWGDGVGGISERGLGSHGVGGRHSELENAAITNGYGGVSIF